MEITEPMSYSIDINDALRIWDQSCGSASAPFALVPGQAIQRYNTTHELPLERILLPDWTAFEYGHIDWDHHDFARLLGLEEVPDHVPLLLVTDEGLRDKHAFRFPRTDFQAFVGWYEDNYHMDFFQPADYLLFDETLDHIRILHHEGAVFREHLREPHRD